MVRFSRAVPKEPLDGLSVVVNLDSEPGPAHAVFTRRDHFYAVSG